MSNEDGDGAVDRAKIFNLGVSRSRYNSRRAVRVGPTCGAGRQVVRCFAAGVPYRRKRRPRHRVKG